MRWKEAPGGHGARVAPAGGKTARVAPGGRLVPGGQTAGWMMERAALGVALAAPVGWMTALAAQGVQTVRVAPAGVRIALAAPFGGRAAGGQVTHDVPRVVPLFSELTLVVLVVVARSTTLRVVVDGPTSPRSSVPERNVSIKTRKWSVSAGGPRTCPPPRSSTGRGQGTPPGPNLGPPSRALARVLGI